MLAWLPLFACSFTHARQGRVVHASALFLNSLRLQGVAPAPAPNPLFFVPATQRAGAGAAVSTSAATFGGQSDLSQFPTFAG